MNISLNNLSSYVRKETLQVVREVLGVALNEDDERRRQEKLAAVIDKKDLRAADDSEGDVDEAEDEDPEDEEEKATKDTGVPATDKKKVVVDKSGGKGTADSPKLATPTDKQIEKASAKSVIDKLNVMRGGKSLKDPEVRRSFEQYFDALAKDEQESMLIYLTAMAQILAGVTTGTAALDPSDVGLTTKGEVEPTSKSVTKRATQNIEKAAEKAGQAGTEAAPIVVGEQQQKVHVRRVLEAYRALS